MISWLIRKTFGTKHDREVKRLRTTVAQINAHEEQLQHLSDDEVKAKTAEFRRRLITGETPEQLLPEAYAVVKNACRRMMGSTFEVTEQQWTWDMIPYDVQLIGGIALHRRGIAEMQTGEGKTLVAIMPLYLNGLVLNPQWLEKAAETYGNDPAAYEFEPIDGIPVARGAQLVTTNDYLARRDCEWVGAVLTWLGLKVGCIQHDQRPPERRAMYACDVCYGTASEFGFDYLRDMGMADSRDHLVQHDHYFVIVDEVDCILIDEAKTPLIIAGPVPDSSHQYDTLKPDIDRLVKDQHKLCTQLLDETRKVLDQEDPDPDDYDDAILNLVRVKLGMPTHKQYLRFMEDPELRKAVEKKEGFVHSDNNRGMLQEIKDQLFFAIDERQQDADLSEKGRKRLKPNDPDFFVLPDLADQYAIIEGLDISADERLAKREAALAEFETRSETLQNVAQLLRAYVLFEKDRNYIVVDGKVVIVDENTGRAMPGRRYADGLHQALEAKEGVNIESETQTMATITIQNYFRMYQKLAGMTGTAETEANEFKEIYDLDVFVIPTNKPCRRELLDDEVYKTKKAKYRAIVDEVKGAHERGQPVLLGTIDVNSSELLSRLLERERIPHNVLNAKNHQREAEIVAQAGQPGNVTIATNMAGRGTDIRLGEGVREAGGLYVIGSERHDSRRIDRQLRGRCARQGDPGMSRFYVSLEDNLMRLFGGDRITSIMERVGMTEGETLSHPWLNRSIEQAQKRVEQHHFGMRKRTLEYDDVMNKQREVVYGQRREALFTDEPRKMMFDYIFAALDKKLQEVERDEKEFGSHLDLEELLAWLRVTFPPVHFQEDDFAVAGRYDAAAMVEQILKRVETTYVEEKAVGEDPEALQWLERQIILNAIDRLWREHLYSMDQLRTSVHLHAQAQRDPLVEYKREAFGIFGDLLDRIALEVAHASFRSATSVASFQRMLSSLPQMEVHQVLGQFEGDAPPPTEEPEDSLAEGTEEAPPEPRRLEPYKREMPKVGRNEPCPCGSGKKYKQCHGKTAAAPPAGR